MDYLSLVVREDLREISRIVELDKVENMLLLLPDRIGSPLSMPGLARDVEAAHTSVKNWLEQLKRLYLIFEVRPWSKKISRGLKKEKKWYFLDWYHVLEPAARLENRRRPTLNLYRYCRALTDMGYGKFSLHYVRTLDKREIDFLVVRDNQPLLAVEVKSRQTTLSPALQDRFRWFGKDSTIGIQVVDQRDVLRKYPGNTWQMSLERFLNIL
jgi:predicted AAA+ superfamily ATPase